MPRTLKLTIAYDGTNYAGWQRQANAQSAFRQVLEDEIATIVGAHYPLNAAGRTDAGVHAAAQVASITIDHPISVEELPRALNARLKAGDIRIRSIEEMFDRFDARIYAKSRPIATRSGMAPRRARFSVTWSGTCRSPLDLDRMVDATKAHVVGEHDFAAFQGRSSDVLTTIRHRAVSGARGDEHPHRSADRACRRSSRGMPDGDGRLLRFEITGTGFLRHMVRIMAGTLVDIGRGNIEVGRHGGDHRSRAIARTARDRRHRLTGLCCGR